MEVRLDASGPPIEGRVVDHEGRPVAGAEVIASWTLGESSALELTGPGVRRVERSFRNAFTRSEHDGRFSLREVPVDGAMRVRVGRFGEFPTRPGREVPPGARDVMLVLDAPKARARVSLELPDDVGDTRIDLVIHEASTGRTWERVIHARAGRTSTELELTPGRILLDATAAGLRSPVLVAEVEPGQDVDVGTLRLAHGGGRLEVVVTWPEGPAPSLRVRRRDPDTGQERFEHRAPPSALGVPLVWSSLPAGPVTLEVVARGASKRSLHAREVMLRDGETTRLELDLASTLRDALPVGDREPR